MGFSAIGSALSGMMGGKKAESSNGGTSQEEYQRAVMAKKMHDKVYENSMGPLYQPTPAKSDSYALFEKTLHSSREAGAQSIICDGIYANA